MWTVKVTFAARNANDCKINIIAHIELEAEQRDSQNVIKFPKHSDLIPLTNVSAYLLNGSE